jgi:hypothetical protein
MTRTPTPEEIEAARQLVAQADAAAAEAAKAAAREKLQPLADVGLGGDAPVGSWADVMDALRSNASALGAIDSNLPNLAFSTAQVLSTMNDRIRSLLAVNASAAPPPEA